MQDVQSLLGDGHAPGTKLGVFICAVCIEILQQLPQGR